MTGVDLEVLCIKVTAGTLIVTDITEGKTFLRKKKKKKHSINLCRDSYVGDVKGGRIRKDDRIFIEELNKCMSGAKKRRLKKKYLYSYLLVLILIE